MNAQQKYILIFNPFIKRTRLITQYVAKYKVKIICVYWLNDLVPELKYGILSAIKFIKQQNKNSIIIKTDGSSFESIIKKLRNYKILGVIVGLENNFKLINKFCDKLDLNLNPPSFTTIWASKFLVNERLKAKKIRYIKSLLIDFNEKFDFNSINDFFDKKYPLIMKPTDTSGSIDFMKCDNQKELLRLINNQKIKINNDKHSKHKFIVQEYIYGDEYAIDFFVCEGRIKCASIWLYHKQIINGHSIYRSMEFINKKTRKIEKMIDYATSAIKACDYKNGFVHSEIKYDKNGPVLIEFNWRMAGGNAFLQHQYINKYTTSEIIILGTIWPHKLMKLLDSFEYFDYHKNHFLAVFFLSSPCSFKLKVDNLNKIMRRLPTFYESISHYKKNQIVPATIDLLTSVATISLLSNNKNKIQSDIKTIEKYQDNRFWEIFERY